MTWSHQEAFESGLEIGLRAATVVLCRGDGVRGIDRLIAEVKYNQGLRASGMEARRAAAENTDAVHDSPTAATSGGDAQP